MRSDFGIIDQAIRALTIARKSIRIFYAKGPVIIFGLLFPIFLFLSFTIGRNMTLDFMLPGFLGTGDSLHLTPHLFH